MPRILGIVVVVWLLIGLLAAYQRGYFSDNGNAGCRSVGNSALTVLAGPLNYAGLNPKMDCKVPQPSK